MASPSPFRIGITMAGAVSAGAYTAGVMDYLLETLQKWQEAKDRNRALSPGNQGYDVSVPMHDVVIEVMTGASAGGMTAAVASAALADEYRPDSTRTGQGKLYDCWVNMDDDAAVKTLDKMLKTEDITQQHKVVSLLNSRFIEHIAAKALRFPNGVRPFPAFISPNLDLIMTLSNTRGVKYNIKFTSNDPSSASKIVMHGGYFHYQFGSRQEDMENGRLFYPLNLEDPHHVAQLTDAAIATGAFPVGLAPRTLRIRPSFIETFSKKKYGAAYGGIIELDESVLAKDHYTFVAVDGGAINNEPLGLAYMALMEKNLVEREDLIQTNGPKQGRNYSIIMISPFPNYLNVSEQDYEPKDHLSALIPRMIGMLRNQAMFRQEDLINALQDEDATNFLIAPTRKIIRGDSRMKAWNALASGAFGGFSGFLSKEFRAHDFILGRKNCQDFIRYYFGFPVSPNNRHQIHEHMSGEAIQRFSYKRGETVYLPVIPDMSSRTAGEDLHRRTLVYFDDYHRQRYNQESEEIHCLPAFPKIHPQTIQSLEPALNARFAAVAQYLVDLEGFLGLSSAGNLWKRMLTWAKRWVLNRMLRAGLRAGSRATVKYVIRELENYELLEKPTT